MKKGIVLIIGLFLIFAGISSYLLFCREPRQLEDVHIDVANALQEQEVVVSLKEKAPEDPMVQAYERQQEKYTYEKRFIPEMGVDGRLANLLQKGEASSMPEGATVWVKTLRGINYIIDLDVSQKDGFLMVKLNPVPIGTFMPLLKSDVAESKRVAWSQVKTFLKKSLKKKESKDLIVAVEDYFKKENFKF